MARATAVKKHSAAEVGEALRSLRQVGSAGRQHVRATAKLKDELAAAEQSGRDLARRILKFGDAYEVLRRR